MVLFPLYSVLVWSLCYRWRRTWIGFACLATGVAAVGMLALLHRLIVRMFDSLDGPLFPMLLGAEAAFTLVVGLFIVSLPMTSVDMPCRRCRYDLAGLEHENPTCPECGMAYAARKVKKRACRACRAEMFVCRGENPPCPTCRVECAVREVKPSRESTVARAITAWAQPLMSRYRPPRRSTSSGSPRIIVIRKIDNTFASIG